MSNNEIYKKYNEWKEEADKSFLVKDQEFIAEITKIKDSNVSIHEMTEKISKLCKNLYARKLLIKYLLEGRCRLGDMDIPLEETQKWLAQELQKIKDIIKKDKDE